MKRYRLLQVCNRNARAHLWVCPWLRDNKTDPFEEWIIRLSKPLKVMAGVDYFIDIEFKTKEIAVSPVGSLHWVFFQRSIVEDISAPTSEDYTNRVVSWAPDLPWLFNSNFSPPD